MLQVKSTQFYLSWSDLGRDNLFKVIRVGREIVIQANLKRGELEQDLAWDRPAALGNQGQGGHQDRVQHHCLFQRCDWSSGFCMKERGAGLSHILDAEYCDWSGGPARA